MARIPEKSPHFRPKDVIARDVAFVLSAPLAFGTKEAVLRNAVWVWTEFDGKYDGCPYWSVDANKERLLYLDNKLNGRKMEKPKFIHEHAVPKRVVIQMIRDLSPVTEEAVRSVCDRFLFGIVVCRTEDERLRKLELHRDMPAAFYDECSPDYHDAWLRYRQASITVTPEPPGWRR